MRIGLAILDCATGERLEVDAREPFPLASVFKLPLLIELARQMQQKRPGLSLERALVIHESDKCVGGGTLRSSPVGTRVTVARCAELMETVSDNTATDMLFHLIGLDSVNCMLGRSGLERSDIFLTNRVAWLISLGAGTPFRGLSARQIADRWLKMSSLMRRRTAAQVEAENRNLTLQQFQALEDASAARQVGDAYAADVAVAEAVDNVASPHDMADLLRLLSTSKLLDTHWTSWCMGVLSRQKFNTRIPRLLPRGTKVYHKTGTIVGVVNDAGLVALPGNGGPLAVVVFVRDVKQGAQADAEKAIAQIARMAFDAFSQGPTPLR
jgi:beta-lactamase class A